MEPLFGKQVSHRKEVKTKKEIGGIKALHKLQREGKAIFMGHKDYQQLHLVKNFIERYKGIFV